MLDGENAREYIDAGTELCVVVFCGAVFCVVLCRVVSCCVVLCCVVSCSVVYCATHNTTQLVMRMWGLTHDLRTPHNTQHDDTQICTSINLLSGILPALTLHCDDTIQHDQTLPLQCMHCTLYIYIYIYIHICIHAYICINIYIYTNNDPQHYTTLHYTTPHNTTQHYRRLD